MLENPLTKHQIGLVLVLSGLGLGCLGLGLLFSGNADESQFWEILFILLGGGFTFLGITFWPLGNTPA